MKEISVMGIDLAKNIFQLHGVSEHGRVVLRRQLRRGELMRFMATVKPCLVGMESCGGANYWAREFQKLGHTVKLMAPQFVKPYRKSDKNDFNDAEAICEAVARPNMRFVPIKQIAQQDVQCLHRIRERMISNRTALVNSVRGFLAEYGIALPKQVNQIRKQLPVVLERSDNELTPMTRRMLGELYEELAWWDERIGRYDEQLKQISKQNEVCQRLLEIEGIGPITATALVASVSEPRAFKSGRQFAAFVGLVPRQNSSGGKTVLLGIHKRGDKYLRKLLVHGARAALRVMRNKSDGKSVWVTRIMNTRGHNKACVALANKNARQIWAVMAKEESYRPAA